MSNLSPNAKLVSTFKKGKVVRYDGYCDTELIARVLPDRLVAKSTPRSD